MMFSENIPIFEQIKKMITDNILTGVWKEDEMIPSVRTMSADLSVNPNTVMKAIQDLQRDGILENVRGLGNRIVPGTRSFLLKKEKKQFLKEKTSDFVNEAKKLGLSIDDIINELRKLK